jgi:peptide-methionine (S)-S-oxide reductase
LPGVIRTRVGYCGGQKQDPTYYSIGDHTETLQIDYDPRRTSYAQLLDVFWKTHNPCARPGSRQYMTAVFYANEEQKKLALETRQRESARLQTPIATQVVPITEFYLAEDYHQKYMLRRSSKLMRDFRAMYPSDADFVRSTAATRSNGYVGGSGSAAMLEQEINSFGLSPEGNQALRDSAARHH